MANFTESMVTIWHGFRMFDGTFEVALDRFIVRWDTFFRSWNIRNETLGEEGAIHAEAYNPEDPQEMVYLTIDPLSALCIGYQYTDHRGVVRAFSLLHGQYIEEKEILLVV